MFYVVSGMYHAQLIIILVKNMIIWLGVVMSVHNSFSMPSLSESRCRPRVLSRRKRFYYKRLLLGAFASEAARQLTSFSG